MDRLPPQNYLDGSPPKLCEHPESMAAAAQISLSEYFETTYRPDREYIIDPKTRTGRMCSGAQWIEARELQIPGTALYVDLEEIFSQVHPEA